MASAFGGGDASLALERPRSRSGRIRRVDAGVSGSGATAAHSHSPIGGRGMNMGILEAITLGHCVQREDVTGSYEIRRRPVARSWVRINHALSQVIMGSNFFFVMVRMWLGTFLLVLGVFMGGNLAQRVFERLTSAKVTQKK